MCAECGMNPCHPRCPNAPEPVPIHECVKCGYGILAGDKFWDSPEGKICEEYSTGKGEKTKAFYKVLELYGFQYPNDEEKGVVEGTSDLYVKKEGAK